ncbi:helix-turn-helix transcriptional regulator [Agrococcus carbonis]|uniref:DNA-binding transcriptional regulator, CsgD family n=1 Tax=Agrococcus carbonis TaxID=684552 RepID=A0A1H1MGR4_9MICO|nr:DNA-binding response regulator [Agrococcus carbonis]SDR85792.1 DNA-binding transcriptional regulator, CsgD family [Agrococcus carbonis]
MAVMDVVQAAPRSVSIVASGPRGALLRDAIADEPGLRLGAIAGRFTDLVVEAAFPGDVVVLAEEPGRQLFAHAVTAAAAGAVVVAHADVDEQLREALEHLGVVVLPLSEPADAVARRIVETPPTRPRGHGFRSGIAGDVQRPRLSAGERRALAHYVQGLTTVQVAAEMGVGYETAKTFLRRVRAKYAAIDRPAGKRSELIVRAEEDGIL